MRARVVAEEPFLVVVGVRISIAMMDISVLKDAAVMRERQREWEWDSDNNGDIDLGGAGWSP
jgi:hypothetical protein